MKAGSEKLLIYMCAELLGMFSFTDKISQKSGLTKSENSENLKINDKIKTWPLDSKMLTGSARSEKNNNRWRRKFKLTAKDLRINVKNSI